MSVKLSPFYRFPGLVALFVLFFSSSCTLKDGNNPYSQSPEAVKIEPLFEAALYQDANGNELPYRFFEPSINDDNKEKLPLILYLHGEEERGTDNKAQVTRTECATIWLEADHLVKNPVYVLAPQLPVNTTWTSEFEYNSTLALLSDFVKDHPSIDTQRIYIVGFSMGATGLWNMILKNPELFAAALPISGSADEFLGNSEAFMAIKNLPVLVVHSFDDALYPVSKANNAIAAMETAGNLSAKSGNNSIWGLGSQSSPHEAWYDAFHKYEVIYNWIFEQNLDRTKNGDISPTTLFSMHERADGIKEIWDYALGTAYVIEGSEKAVIVDAAAGGSSIYNFIRDNVLTNKDIDLEILVTHNHFDHILGLSSFIGASQLKTVYVHKEDSESIIRYMGPDAGKVKLISDGDKIPFDEKEIEVIHVPGHTLGSVMFYMDKYLFAGDGVGSGDAWMGFSPLSIEEFVPSIQHVLDIVSDNRIIYLGGHTGEYRELLTDNYIREVLACAKGLVDGSVESIPYWRTIGGQATLGYAGTVGKATIVHNLNNIHRIKGALKSLDIREVNISPRFAPYTAYYTATVSENTKNIDIIPAALSANTTEITINGIVVKSGSAATFGLQKGKNLFEVLVTEGKNASKKYTLTVNSDNLALNRPLQY